MSFRSGHEALRGKGAEEARQLRPTQRQSGCVRHEADKETETAETMQAAEEAAEERTAEVAKEAEGLDSGDRAGEENSIF